MKQARTSNDVEHTARLLRKSAGSAGLDTNGLELPRDRYVNLNKMQFHYLDWEAPRSRVIVFLHGGGMNAHSFDVVCASLRKRHRCISLDQRGHGDTDWAPDGDYTVTANSSDIRSFVDALDLDEFVLVGMSQGGLAALHYAGTRPRGLAALVVIDTGPRTEAAGRARIRKTMTRVSAFNSLDEAVQYSLSLNPNRDPEIIKTRLANSLRQLDDGRWTWKWDPRVAAPKSDGELETRTAMLWSAVERIRKPVLVVRGVRSDVFTDANADDLAGRLETATITRIENAGHNVQGDNPGMLADAIADFVKSLGS